MVLINNVIAIYLIDITIYTKPSYDNLKIFILKCTIPNIISLLLMSTIDI